MLDSYKKRWWYELTAVYNSRWLHPLLLLLWVAIGVGLRFGRLTSKAPWTDEFSTIVFSLGHSFRTVPLDQAIAPEVLLQPLQTAPATGIGDVLHHLLEESNHPPIYFLLAHLWMGLFPPVEGLASLSAARSLSALFGVASIPAIFGFCCLAFRSRLVAQLAAAIMAVSPYGIFLSQEARHYTLAILLVIASLCCLIIAARTIHQRTRLPIWVGLTWVAVNALGVATHYFFTLTLCAEALVLITQGVRHRCWKKRAWLQFYWWRLYLVAAGTLLGSLVWLPHWQSNFDSGLTTWIYTSDPLVSWIEPIGRFLIWVITMLVALPIEVPGAPIALAIISALVTVIFLCWSLPILNRGFKNQSLQPHHRLSVQVLSEFVIWTLVLFLVFTYGLGADLTLAPRYNFLFFPAVIALIGVGLTAYWTPTATNQQPSVFRFTRGGKKAVLLIWLVGLLGGLTVIWNFSYLQNNRLDLLANIIQKESHSPVLIAIVHKHHGQTGRMMTLAWQFQHSNLSDSSVNHAIARPQFLLAHAESDSQTARNPTTTLKEAVAGLPRPLDVWLVDFDHKAKLKQQNCFAHSQRLPKLNGVRYKLYHCDRA